MPATIIDTVRLVLGVARLGETDLRGWWRTHGLNATGRYVLAGAFPRTWQAAALEISIASAARTQDRLLGRSSALHLFSDQLPFRRWARAWVAEQKTVVPDPLFDVLQRWDEASAVVDLRGWTGSNAAGHMELVGDGLLLGTLSQAELRDSRVRDMTARLLASAYLDQGSPLRPPYFDLVV